MDVSSMLLNQIRKDKMDNQKTTKKWNQSKENSREYVKINLNSLFISICLLIHSCLYI